MSGTILDKNEIIKLIEQKQLSIKPSFELDKLQIAQYPLTALRVYEINKNFELIQVHEFSTLNSKFYLLPKKYYLIDILEEVLLPEGIIGRFIPSSNLLEKGLSILTGKIENPYGRNGEKIRFSIYNCLDFESPLEMNSRIAYIQFIDLRSKEKTIYNLTDYENHIYSKRKNYDDGPNYEIDNHD